MYQIPSYLDDVKAQTGLVTHEALIYNIFARDASFADGIIRNTHVQYELGEFLEEFYGQAMTQLGKRENYNFWEELFKEKELLQHKVRTNGMLSLELTGYNPYEDLKHFTKYRIKGTSSWIGRMPRKTYLQESTLYLKDYEFQEMIN